MMEDQSASNQRTGQEGQAIETPALVLFDFDGTLADSYPAIAASVNFTRSKYDLPPLEIETIKRFVGRGPDYLLGQTVPGIDPREAYLIYRDHHPSVARSGTVLLPGTFPLLSYLKEKQVQMGICSNKPRHFTEILVKYLEIAEFFTLILGPEDVKNRKPAPDMLIEAVKRAQVARESALYVGDMSVDVQTGRAAGVTVWAVTTGSETREEIEEAGPNRLFSSMVEILDALKNSNCYHQAPSGSNP